MRCRVWENNYLIRPIGSRQPLLEGGEALLDAAGPGRRLEAVEAHFDAAPLEARDALLHVRGPPGPEPVRRAGQIAESQRRGLPEAQGRERARGRGAASTISLATPPTILHHDGA